MSLDPRNLPFNSATAPSGSGPGNALPPLVSGGAPNDTLTIENVLLAEFNYASTTAYQAMEDRARMFDRYLLIIGGVFVSGIGAIKQLNDSGFAEYTHAVALVFLVAGMGAGTSFFLSLVNLRKAWQRSAICMNVIKEFYINRFANDLRRAFFWRMFTLPKLERITSVNGTVCLVVLTLNSLCAFLFALVGTQIALFGTGSSFAQLSDTPVAQSILRNGGQLWAFGLPQTWFYVVLYGPACAVFVVAVSLHMLYFRLSLKEGLKKALAEAQATFDGLRPEKNWVTGDIIPSQKPAKQQ